MKDDNNNLAEFVILVIQNLNMFVKLNSVKLCFQTMIVLKFCAILLTVRSIVHLA